jgi:O-antigen ligase
LLAYSRLVEVYESSPVVGHGLKSTEVVNTTRAGTTTVRTPENPTGRVGANPHSTVMRALVEGGPLLLAAWIALLAALIGGMWRLTRGRSEEVRPYARILLVLWIVMAIAGTASGDIASFTAEMFALLALTGALVGSSSRSLHGSAGPG